MLLSLISVAKRHHDDRGNTWGWGAFTRPCSAGDRQQPTGSAGPHQRLWGAGAAGTSLGHCSHRAACTNIAWLPIPMGSAVTRPPLHLPHSRCVSNTGSTQSPQLLHWSTAGSAPQQGPAAAAARLPAASGRPIPMPLLFTHFYFRSQPVPWPSLEPRVMWTRGCQAGRRGAAVTSPDVLCGQGAGAGGPERGPSLALQLPDLAAIQRDPAKCYFLNTLAFHNNLTTLLSFTSSLKRELDSFWLIYTDCIWKPSETEL